MRTPNFKLNKYIERRLTQPTVILCFRIVLENVLKKGIDSGMSKPEIAAVFNRDNTDFGIQKFKTDYILRQTGVGEKNAIYEHDNLFYIEESFLTGLDKSDIINLIEFINSHYLEIKSVRAKLYNEIKNAYQMNVSGRRNFIMHMLLNKETEKKGQSFEVTAFAILKVFYSNRGFGLNRFSTIYSNDGGIDYTSQTSIYQVTTLISDTKFDEDIRKAPLKNRIFVFRNTAKGFDFAKFDHELVTDYISSVDLEKHLNYLLDKRPEVNSELVLDVLLNEFEREHYL